MSLEGMTVEGTDISTEYSDEKPVLEEKVDEPEKPKSEKPKSKKENDEEKIVLEIIEKDDYSKSKYKKLYDEIFANYSLTKFREHINQNHPELKRLNPGDGKKMKIISLMGESNAILRGMGYVLGLKRTKAKSTKKSKYEDAFNEREDLRELVIAKIMMPMLRSMKMGEKDILQKDIQAVEEEPKQKEETKPINQFRVGAVIDVEKLGINVDLLRQVLTTGKEDIEFGSISSVSGRSSDVGKESEGSFMERARDRMENKMRERAKERMERERDAGVNPPRRLPEDPENPGKRQSSVMEFGFRLTTQQQGELEERIEEEFADDEVSVDSSMREEGTQELQERYNGLKERLNRGNLSLEEAINTINEIIDGTNNRRQAQRQASAQGLQDPVYKQLSKDINLYRAYRAFLTRKLNRSREIAEELSESGSVIPASTKPSALPKNDTQDANIGSHDANKIVKQSTESFVPGRRQVIKKASQLVLRSVRKSMASKMKNPISEPDDVNYYAPSVRHRYRGGLRVIQ